MPVPSLLTAPVPLMAWACVRVVTPVWLMLSVETEAIFFCKSILGQLHVGKGQSTTGDGGDTTVTDVASTERLGASTLLGEC